MNNTARVIITLTICTTILLMACIVLGTITTWYSAILFTEQFSSAAPPVEQIAPAPAEPAAVNCVPEQQGPWPVDAYNGGHNIEVTTGENEMMILSLYDPDGYNERGYWIDWGVDEIVTTIGENSSFLAINSAGTAWVFDMIVCSNSDVQANLDQYLTNRPYETANWTGLVSINDLLHEGMLIRR